MPTQLDVHDRPAFEDYQAPGKTDLETWLAKEAEVAQGGIKPEDDEDKSTTNYSDIYPTPEGRRDGSNIDGQWGEPPNMENGRQEPFHQNNATYRESQKDRLGVALRAFDTLPTAEKADKALLGANLDHAKSGDFTTHSVTLQRATKEGSARPTLRELVRKLTDNS